MSLHQWILKWKQSNNEVITCALGRDSVKIYDKFIEITDLIDEFIEYRKNHLKTIEEHSILKVNLEVEKNDRNRRSTDYTDYTDDTDDTYSTESTDSTDSTDDTDDESFAISSEDCRNNDVAK